MTPESLPDPLSAAISFGVILDDIGIPYLVGGSFASSVHGEPRSTNDIDIVADLHTEHVDPLLSALATDYYVSDDAVRSAVALGERGSQHSSFNAIHLSGAIKIDVFIAGTDAFEQERLRSRQPALIPGAMSATVYVDIPEYILLRKLEWYRRGGETSDRQWRDVLAIARQQEGKLDQRRLDRWAEWLGVTDLLERLRENT